MYIKILKDSDFPSYHKFEEEINVYLQNGWTLHGPMTILMDVDYGSGYRMFQVMLYEFPKQ